MDPEFNHGPDFYARLTVRLSLHGLMPYWQALQLDMAPIEAVREAAEAAVRRHPSSYGHPPSEPVAPTLLREITTRTSGGTAQDLRTWMESRNFDGLFHGIALWENWFSEHQHGRAVEGLDPALSARLIGLWRDGVVVPTAAYEQRMMRELPTAPMPDWDMGQHADHEICYFATGRFSTPDVVIALAGEYRFIRHCQFMMQHVLSMPSSQRDTWERVVQHHFDARHQELDADPKMQRLHAALPHLAKLPPRIPPLEELF